MEDRNEQLMPSKSKYEDFMDLYSAHSRRIYGHISMLLPNSGDVDDVFQETSKLLWEKFDEFEPGSNFYAWASSIARYQVLAYLQQRKRNRVSFSTEFIVTISAQVQGQADLLEAKHRALAECLSKLKPRDRDLIELRYSPDATTKSVAQQVGRSVAGVYKALNRIESALLRCVRFALAAETQGFYPE